MKTMNDDPQSQPAPDARPHPSARRPGESAADHDTRLVSMLEYLGRQAQAEATERDAHADEKADYAAWQQQRDADLAASRRAEIQRE